MQAGRATERRSAYRSSAGILEEAGTIALPAVAQTNSASPASAETADAEKIPSFALSMILIKQSASL
jgi:hypothetical protein